MRNFFKVIKYIFFTILTLVILIVVGLNIYYSILQKSINEREYPDPSTLKSNMVPDELVNFQINLVPYPQKVELLPGF